MGQTLQGSSCLFLRGAHALHRHFDALRIAQRLGRAIKGTTNHKGVLKTRHDKLLIHMDCFRHQFQAVSGKNWVFHDVSKSQIRPELWPRATTFTQKPPLLQNNPGSSHKEHLARTFQRCHVKWVPSCHGYSWEPVAGVASYCHCWQLGLMDIWLHDYGNYI